MTNYFNVGAFFVLFRESVEAAVILSVLLAFVERRTIDQEKRISLKRQVWIGTISGIVLSIIIGVALTVTFYVAGKDLFGQAEALWEGILGLLAVLLLTGLAFRMLYVNTLISKWEQKMQHHMDQLDDSVLNEKGFSSESSWFKSYSLAALSFTVVIREGLEAVIFIAGVMYFMINSRLDKPILYLC
jgi:high-affinity iron transporter